MSIDKIKDAPTSLKTTFALILAEVLLAQVGKLIDHWDEQIESQVQNETSLRLITSTKHTKD